jgi:flagellar biosynthesis protein FlhB
MGESTATIVGIIVGFIFGMSGIATLFNILEAIASGAATQLSNLGTASTLVILVIAVILIIKVRVISALIVGAIIGAVLNLILKANGVDLMKEFLHLVT